jgi:hypothetical protein
VKSRELRKLEKISYSYWLEWRELEWRKKARVCEPVADV